MDIVYLLILAGLYAVSHGLVWALDRLGKVLMSTMYWLAGLLALFLFGYLLYALLRAERF